LAWRYGEFVLLVVMLLVAILGLSVAMQAAAGSATTGRPASQYTVDAQLWINDTANRTVLDRANLRAPQRTEFTRARNATLSTETEPTLVEYAAIPS
jgi:hypothetical protein